MCQLSAGSSTMAIQSVGPEVYLPLQHLIPQQQRQFTGQAPTATSLPSAKPSTYSFGPAVSYSSSSNAAPNLSGKNERVQGKVAQNPLNQQAAVSKPETSLAPPTGGRGLYLDITA